jgi:hypothetical protein
MSDNRVKCVKNIPLTRLFQPISSLPQVTYSSSEEDEFFDATSNGISDESDTTEEEECATDCTESAESVNGHKHYHKKRSVFSRLI